MENMTCHHIRYAPRLLSLWLCQVISAIQFEKISHDANLRSKGWHPDRITLDEPPPPGEDPIIDKPGGDLPEEDTGADSDESYPPDEDTEIEK